MNFNRPIDLYTIIKLINASCVGDETNIVYGINEASDANQNDISFSLDSNNYTSNANCILTTKAPSSPNPNKTYLIVEHIVEAYNTIVLTYQVWPFMKQIYADDLKIGRNTLIQHNVVIGENVKIGNNTFIYPNATIYPNTIIGDNVIIHAGSVIGAPNENDHICQQTKTKYLPSGNVIIEDNVIIGANCCIHSAFTATKLIKSGTTIKSMTVL